MSDFQHYTNDQSTDYQACLNFSLFQLFSVFNSNQNFLRIGQL